MREGGGDADGRGQRWGGLALALFAAALLVLSVFGPKLDCPTLRLEHNRLIDSWEGWVMIGCAVLAMLGASLGLWRRRWGWLDCAAGAAALGLVIYASTGSRLIVQPGPEAAGKGTMGFALIVAGLGALVAIGAGLTVALARPASTRSRRPAKTA